MLDRAVVGEFLDTELEELEIEIPKDITKEVLVETFCRYVENDYYEWLQSNFKTFFNQGSPNWDWVKERIKQYSKE